MIAEGSPEKSAGLSCSKLKMDSLFFQWFSLPETQKLVVRLLDDVKAGRPITSSSARKATIAPGHATTPPLSPRKAGPAPLSPSKPPLLAGHHKGLQISQQLHLQTGNEAPVIPRFYFPSNNEIDPDEEQNTRTRLQQYLQRCDNAENLKLDELRMLLKHVFKLPMSLVYCLMNKLGIMPSNSISSAPLLAWFEAKNLFSKDGTVRAFEVLRQDKCSFISLTDLKCLMNGILASHPGLIFLQESPEFQERYAETVIYRILYSLNRSGGNRLSLRDLRRSDILDALHELDDEEDINKLTKYFSYEHFYVIYCKFWDLDTDHDFLLSRDDLLRYGNHALTYRIVERIFSQCGRPFASTIPGHMNYEDFVWFILSEEDKSTDASLEYWFRCCDLASDGRLTADELLFFYEEQLHRMECLSQECVIFDDVLAQMRDMLGPADASCFTLRDLKRARNMAGTLFNVLFNLNKFVAFETRDPFTIRQEREDAASGASEWDRFARLEYMRLAIEEDGGDDADDAMPWAIEGSL